MLNRHELFPILLLAAVFSAAAESPYGTEVVECVTGEKNPFYNNPTNALGPPVQFVPLYSGSMGGVSSDAYGGVVNPVVPAFGTNKMHLSLVTPDEEEQISAQLRRLADQRQVSLVVTSGGTGFSLRDRTPEATMAVAERNAPGIAEAIRVKSLQITDKAMLSRGASVIRGRTLIVNLPGSPKAVKESLGFILGALDHGLGILRGTATD